MDKSEMLRQLSVDIDIEYNERIEEKDELIHDQAEELDRLRAENEELKACITQSGHVLPKADDPILEDING